MCRDDGGDGGDGDEEERGGEGSYGGYHMVGKRDCHGSRHLFA